MMCLPATVGALTIRRWFCHISKRERDSRRAALAARMIRSARTSRAPLPLQGQFCSGRFGRIQQKNACSYAASPLLVRGPSCEGALLGNATQIAEASMAAPSSVFSMATLSLVWWLSSRFCYELKTTRAGALTKAKLCSVGVRETTNFIDVKNTTGPHAIPPNRSVIPDLLQQPDVAGLHTTARRALLEARS